MAKYGEKRPSASHECNRPVSAKSNRRVTRSERHSVRAFKACDTPAPQKIDRYARDDEQHAQQRLPKRPVERIADDCGGDDGEESRRGAGDDALLCILVES